MGWLSTLLKGTLSLAGGLLIVGLIIGVFLLVSAMSVFLGIAALVGAIAFGIYYSISSEGD